MTNDPEQQATLMLVFTSAICILFFALGVMNFIAAIANKIWISYLYGSLLFIFGFMQIFSVLSMIKAKKQISHTKKEMNNSGINFLDGEITPEDIDKLLDKQNAKSN